jgi:hypothetical protein
MTVPGRALRSGGVTGAGGVPDAVRESDATLTAAPDLAWFNMTTY